MMRASWPRSRKYSPIVQPEYGAMYCIAAGRDLLDRVGHLGRERALAVDRLAERVHDAADELRADGHLEDAAGRFHRVALGDVLVGSEHDGADRVALEVQREAEGVAREFE